MCGRFVQIDATITRLAGIKDLQIDSASVMGVKISGNYNLSPQDSAMVIGAEGQLLELKEMRWGLQPGWTNRLIINARTESLYHKPTFRHMIQNRIAIPVEGFYEWARDADDGTPTRSPYFFSRRDGLPLLLAGLSERTADPETGEITGRFVIATAQANSMMSRYHERMPVIVDPGRIHEWVFEAGDPTVFNEITRPAEPETLSAHRVGKAVNSPNSQGPQLIEPAENVQSLPFS